MVGGGSARADHSPVRCGGIRGSDVSPLVRCRGECRGGPGARHANMRDRLRRARVAGNHIGRARRSAREPVSDGRRGSFRHSPVALTRSASARKVAGSPGAGRARNGVRATIAGAQQGAGSRASLRASRFSTARRGASPANGADPCSPRPASRREAPPGRVEAAAQAARHRGLSQTACISVATARVNAGARRGSCPAFRRGRRDVRTTPNRTQH